jgi:chromosome segregation ATPase
MHGLGLSISHHQPIAVQLVIGEQPMSVEILTYAALGARLNISPEAARSLSRRLGLSRSLSDHGKALVSVDLAEIRHTSRPPRRRAGNSALPVEFEALKAEIARLETTAADRSADFERERERADRLAVELLQATAETTAAQEVTARLDALKAEIARLETTAADRSADFERERERADRLAVELLQATAETTAAQEVTARLEASKAEIARLETTAADHRADFERERADRLAVELLQATAEMMAAKEMTARLEGEVAALRTAGRAAGSTDTHGQAARRLGNLAATIVEADRKACR